MALLISFVYVTVYTVRLDADEIVGCVVVASKLSDSVLVYMLGSVRLPSQDTLPFRINIT